MKKLTAIILALSLLCGLGACISKSPNQPVSEAAPQNVSDNANDLSASASPLPDASPDSTAPNVSPSPGASSMPKDAKPSELSANPSNNTSSDTPAHTPAPSPTPSIPYVTISIGCQRAVDNWDKLDEEYQDESVVPKNGIILSTTKVLLVSGESAFSLLSRICRERNIHMEHTITPGLNSAYVEGINNLYEFSCGPLSGWMYSVNGSYQSQGSSAYILKDGDVVRWDYTCDLGRDL